MRSDWQLLSAGEHNLANDTVPGDEHVLIVDMDPVRATSRPPEMAVSPICDDIAIVPVSVRQPLAARPTIIVAILVLAHDLVNDSARDCREQKLFIVVANPMIAARWRAKIVLSPIAHDILVLAILVRQPVAARPMGPIVTRFVEALGIVPSAAVLARIRRLTLIVLIVALVILVIALCDGSGAAEQRERDDRANEMFHLFPWCALSGRTAATVDYVAEVGTLLFDGDVVATG